MIRTAFITGKKDFIIHMAQSENFRDFPGNANDIF